MNEIKELLMTLPYSKLSLSQSLIGSDNKHLDFTLGPAKIESDTKWVEFGKQGSKKMFETLREMVR